MTASNSIGLYSDRLHRPGRGTGGTLPPGAETRSHADERAAEASIRLGWVPAVRAIVDGQKQVLPRLLTTAQIAVAAYPGTDDQAQRARTLLSQTYQVTASTLWKLKEGDLAWLAAERGLVLAEETGDSLLISDAARRVTHGLMVMNHYDQALELVRADIERLEHGRGTGYVWNSWPAVMPTRTAA